MKCPECGMGHNPLNECICQLPRSRTIKRPTREERDKRWEEFFKKEVANG